MASAAGAVMASVATALYAVASGRFNSLAAALTPLSGLPPGVLTRRGSKPQPHTAGCSGRLLVAIELCQPD
jgi:hypothetical protein